jgi:hypothetical protein
VRWDERKADYGFIDELELIRKSIHGGGNLERFDYWLNMFRYLRAVGKFACSEGELKRLIVKVEKEEKEKREGYWDSFVAIRKRQISELEEAYGFFISTISTTAELGTIANWQQHIRQESLEKPAKQIEQLMGRQLPSDCWPNGNGLAVTNMVVPTVRTAIRRGESLKLSVLFYGERPKIVNVEWRFLGGKSSKSAGFTNVGRNVYEVTVPAGELGEDFEYRIEAPRNDGNSYSFPATVEKAWQSVVVY